MRVTPWLFLLWSTTRFCIGTYSVSLFINDFPLHVKNISVDCDMLADDTTLHTSGKDILQNRNNMQDSLDQVPNWCDIPKPKEGFRPG